MVSHPAKISFYPATTCYDLSCGFTNYVIFVALVRNMIERFWECKRPKIFVMGLAAFHVWLFLRQKYKCFVNDWIGDTIPCSGSVIEMRKL